MPKTRAQVRESEKQKIDNKKMEIIAEAADWLRYGNCSSCGIRMGSCRKIYLKPFACQYHRVCSTCCLEFNLVAPDVPEFDENEDVDDNVVTERLRAFCVVTERLRAF
eukprot:Pgem_evm1s11100